MTLVMDVTIDGGLLGITLTQGHGTRAIAVLFALAFAPELFFLGVSLAKNTGRGSVARSLGICATVGLGVLAAAFGGLGLVAISRTAAITALAFGAAGIAYFVTEELLREAYEERVAAVFAALFFAGFLPLFIAAVAIQ